MSWTASAEVVPYTLRLAKDPAVEFECLTYSGSRGIVIIYTICNAYINRVYFLLTHVHNRQGSEGCHGPYSQRSHSCSTQCPKIPQPFWLGTTEPFEGNTLKLKTVGTEMIWLQCRASKIVVINSDDFIQIPNIQCIKILNFLVFQLPPWVLKTESLISGWILLFSSCLFLWKFIATFQLSGVVSSRRWKMSYPWRRMDLWQADRHVVHGYGSMLRPIVAKSGPSLAIPPRSMWGLPIRPCNLLKLYSTFLLLDLTCQVKKNYQFSRNATGSYHIAVWWRNKNHPSNIYQQMFASYHKSWS